MKSPPQGWPRLSASVFYEDPKAAIEWLCRAFGFEVRLKVEGDNGSIAHSELTFGEAVIMVGDATHRREAWQDRYRSPRALGGAVTAAFAFYIDDVDAHFERAAAAGAQVVREPRTDDYGPDYWVDRTYGVTDPEGHLWWFIQRISR
jgi:uncharacterized glyoxalase superfamily protein PhnB